MKYLRFIAVFIAAVVTLGAYAVDYLTPQQQVNGKWGYVTQTGRLMIRGRYDDARPFKEGFAAVSNNGKWGFIDQQGHTLAKIEYDMVEDFYGTYAIVMKDGLYGAINTKGVLEIPCDYTDPAELLDLKVLRLSPDQVEKIRQRFNKK